MIVQEPYMQQHTSISVKVVNDCTGAIHAAAESVLEGSFSSRIVAHYSKVCWQDLFLF